MIVLNEPNPIEHLEKFEQLVRAGQSFTFIRFSDGELEIIRNRALEIRADKTLFRGSELSTCFPLRDTKTFDPVSCKNLRSALFESAMFRAPHYYKGVRTRCYWDRQAIKDRELLLRLGGGFDKTTTFADLFVNSQYSHFCTVTLPLLASEFHTVFVICNFRSELRGCLEGATKVPIPDDSFLDFRNVCERIMAVAVGAPPSSLILSSASSLSNIVGYQLFMRRPDLTFLDVGTAIDPELGFDDAARDYLKNDRRSRRWPRRYIEAILGKHKVTW